MEGARRPRRTNFLDNPVINAIERNTMTFAAVSTFLGAIVGFLLGLFLRRRQARAAQ
jgi:ABC-type Fe3+ transport system permease subunit